MAQTPPRRRRREETPFHDRDWIAAVATRDSATGVPRWEPPMMFLDHPLDIEGETTRPEEKDEPRVVVATAVGV